MYFLPSWLTENAVEYDNYDGAQTRFVERYVILFCLAE